MNIETLRKIFDLLNNGNPENKNLNHVGLNELGKILFYPTKQQELRSKEFHSFIQDQYSDGGVEMLESLRTFHFSSFFTDKETINEQIQFLKNNKFNPQTILEPSAGNGAYAIALAKQFPNATVLAIEPDLLTFSTLKSSTKRYKNISCINQRFENFYLENTAKFDLVASNIPFGDLKIENAFQHKGLFTAEKNVNVFFNSKIHNIVNEGGLSMIITSKQFLDNEKYSPLRKSIFEKNDLIQAIRFDNELFENEKTSVVADLIIYQKNSNKISLTDQEKKLSETTNIDLNINTNDKKEFQINSYLYENQNQINGKIITSFFHNRYDITISNNGISNQFYLNKLLTNTSLSNIIINREPILFDAKQVGTTTEEIKVAPLTPEEKSIDDEKQNNLTLSTNRESILYTNTFHYNNNEIFYYKDKDNFSLFKIDPRDYDLFTNYIELKNNYVRLIEGIKNNDLNNDQIKTSFNTVQDLYDMFTFRFESLYSNITKLRGDSIYSTLVNKIEIVANHKATQRETFKLESFLSLVKLDTLEEIKNDSILEISNNKFEKPVFKTEDDLKTNIFKYYNSYGKLDEIFLSKLYNQEPAFILNEALKLNAAFMNPIFDENNKFVNYRFELLSNLISGSIDDKIKAIQEHELPYNIDNNNVIQILNANKNEIIPIQDIEFNFESSYISNKIKSSFFEELIGEKIEVVSGKHDTTISLLYRQQNNWDADTRYSIKPDEKLNIKGKLSYRDLFDCFATNRFPQVRYTIKKSNGDSESKIDVQGTMVAINKYEQLQLEFKAFIFGNEIYKHEIEKNYYDLFLSDKVLKIESDCISTPKSFTKIPYKHQLEAVAFALNKGTSLIDHSVGQGKTLTMSLLAYKLIEHKKAKRVLITTEKPVAADFQKALEESFPTLNVIRLDTDKNFSSKNRTETLMRIASSNIDIIIAENTHLPYIQKGNDIIQSVYDKNLKMIEQDLENAKTYGGIQKETKAIIQGLEKRKNTLKEELNKNIAKNSEKATGISLEDLKIEALIIDEAHNFKNIQYTTRHKNVGGLNASQISTKNFDLETTIHSIHKRMGYDKNIFMFSGTPIINSVTEMYAYQRFLTPNFLERKNIINFDSWASNFLKQSIQAESDIFGNAKLHSRFRYFTNIPELSKMYHSFTHISDENSFNTHNFKLKEKFVKLETCDEYDDLKIKSIAFAKDKNQIDLFGAEKYSKESMAASFVTALTLNRKALIDPLSIGNTTCDFNESHQYKLHRIVKDAIKIYNKTTEHKGVVLIFTDLNTWSRENPKNTCSTLRKILVEQYGINENEIGISQEYISKNKNFEFQEKIRQGEIRFAIGSTSTMGTGTNIQERIVGILAMDIPYTPHAEIQRLGRMLRAGNKVLQYYNNTGIYRTYGIKETTDIFSYSLNKHKQKFLKQIKSEVHSLRTFDDAYTDITQVSAGQKEMMLIGDVDNYKLVKLEEDLKQIELQKNLFDRSKNNAVVKIEKFTHDNNTNLKKVADYKYLNEIIQKYIPNLDSTELTIAEKKEKVRDMFISLNSINDTYSFIKEYSYDDIAKHIEMNTKNMFTGQTQKELFTFHLNEAASISFSFNKIDRGNSSTFGFFSLEAKINNNKILLKGSSRAKFDQSITPNHLHVILKSLPEKIKDLSWEIDMNKKSIDSNQKILNTEFSPQKIEEMVKIKDEVKKIKLRISKR